MAESRQVFRKVFGWNNDWVCCFVEELTQQRQLISVRKPSRKHNKYLDRPRNSHLHASKYKEHEFHRRYIVKKTQRTLTLPKVQHQKDTWNINSTDGTSSKRHKEHKLYRWYIIKKTQRTLTLPMVHHQKDTKNISSTDGTSSERHKKH